MGFKHCWIKRVTGRVQINEISACLLTADTLHSKHLALQNPAVQA